MPCDSLISRQQAICSCVTIRSFSLIKVNFVYVKRVIGFCITGFLEFLKYLSSVNLPHLELSRFLLLQVFETK